MRFQRTVLFAAVAGGLATLGACTSWHVAQLPPAQFVEAHHDRVLVELRDGSVHELAAPKVEGDSLTGVVAGSAAAGTPLVREAYALPDVASVASPDRDAAKTVGAVVGPPALALLGLFLMSE